MAATPLRGAVISDSNLLAGETHLLSIFEIVAGLLTLTAVFAWLNNRWLRLPNNVGLLIMGLAASLVLIGFEVLIPHVAIYEDP